MGSSSSCAQVCSGSLPTCRPARTPGRAQWAGSVQWELPTVPMSPVVPLCPPGHSPVSMTLPHAPAPRPQPSLPKPVPQDPAPHPTPLPACAPEKTGRGAQQRQCKEVQEVDAGCGAYLGPQLGTPGLTPRTGPVHWRTGPAHLAGSPSHLPQGTMVPSRLSGQDPMEPGRAAAQTEQRSPRDTARGTQRAQREAPAPLHLRVVSSSPMSDAALL